MKDRKITHEVKLQKSVIIILAVLAVGVMANAFTPAFSIKDAMAQLTDLDTIKVIHRTPYEFRIKCSGCN